MPADANAIAELCLVVTCFTCIPCKQLLQSRWVAPIPMNSFLLVRSGHIPECFMCVCVCVYVYIFIIYLYFESIMIVRKVDLEILIDLHVYSTPK
jgi:hypothetical protein